MFINIFQDLRWVWKIVSVTPKPQILVGVEKAEKMLNVVRGGWPFMGVEQRNRFVGKHALDTVTLVEWPFNTRWPPGSLDPLTAAASHSRSDFFSPWAFVFHVALTCPLSCFPLSLFLSLILLVIIQISHHLSLPKAVALCVQHQRDIRINIKIREEWKPSENLRACGKVYFTGGHCVG